MTTFSFFRELVLRRMKRWDSDVNVKGRWWHFHCGRTLHLISLAVTTHLTIRPRQTYSETQINIAPTMIRRGIMWLWPLFLCQTFTEKQHIFKNETAHTMRKINLGLINSNRTAFGSRQINLIWKRRIGYDLVFSGCRYCSRLSSTLNVITGSPINFGARRDLRVEVVGPLLSILNVLSN